MELPSKLINDAVNEFSRLPGIGKKTALRLVLHLLKQPIENTQSLGNAVVAMREQIKFCKNCYNVSDENTCSICLNKNRNEQLICVVENIRDVISIEKTGQFYGQYHVLGGVISPMDGVGPDNLKIEELEKRVNDQKVTEIIMALNPTMEGDTTVFYISQKLVNLAVKVTTLARGVAFGGDLEYVDELTLARSLATRTTYEKYLVKED